jgi:hypothetical protein
MTGDKSATLYNLMETALHEAVGTIKYYQPEQFDNAEHATAWAESVSEKEQLLARVAAEPRPYTFEHLEAAACAWEFVLNQLRRNLTHGNPWKEFQQAYGVAALRERVVQHTHALETAYQDALKNGYDKDFDWEFVPQYMHDHVTRILT